MARKAKEMTDGWTEATTQTTSNVVTDEWQEVEAEQQIVIEQIGDGFIGKLMGIDPPNSSGIIQAHWTMVTDLQANYLLDSAFLNLTRDLINKLKKVPTKAMVRVEWTQNLNTGHESGTPMRVYDVRWKM